MRHLDRVFLRPTNPVQEGKTLKHLTCSRLVFALPVGLAVVVAMFLSAARPAQACVGFPYAVAGINCDNVFIGLGRTPLDPSTHLSLTFDTADHMVLTPSFGGYWSPYFSHPGVTALGGVAPGGTLTPIGGGQRPESAPDGSTPETGVKPVHLGPIETLLYMMGVPPEAIGHAGIHDDGSSLGSGEGSVPSSLILDSDTGGDPNVESVVPELTPIVTIAGKEVPEERFLASFGSRLPESN